MKVVVLDCHKGVPRTNKTISDIACGSYSYMYSVWLVIVQHCIKLNKQSCICVLGILICPLSLSIIFLLDFGTVPTVWYIFFFILLSLFWKAFPEKYIDMLIFFAVAENVSSKLIIAIRKILICCILIIASSYGSRISNKNNAHGTK